MFRSRIKISKGILHGSLSNFGFFRTSLCNISKPTDDKEKDYTITFVALKPLFNLLSIFFLKMHPWKMNSQKVVIPSKPYFHGVNTEEFSFCDHFAMSIHRGGGGAFSRYLNQRYNVCCRNFFLWTALSEILHDKFQKLLKVKNKLWYNFYKTKNTPVILIRIEHFVSGIFVSIQNVKRFFWN